jgi:hypothetical protein
MPHSDFLSDRARVDQSTRRLFERLNPVYRPGDAGVLAVYDWEITQDAGLGLEAVQAALRALDGASLRIQVINAEHRVVGLADLGARAQVAGHRAATSPPASPQG